MLQAIRATLLARCASLDGVRKTLVAETAGDLKTRRRGARFNTLLIASTRLGAGAATSMGPRDLFVAGVGMGRPSNWSA